MLFKNIKLGSSPIKSFYTYAATFLVLQVVVVVAYFHYGLPFYANVLIAFFICWGQSLCIEIQYPAFLEEIKKKMLVAFCFLFLFLLYNYLFLVYLQFH